MEHLHFYRSCPAQPLPLLQRWLRKFGSVLGIPSSILKTPTTARQHPLSRTRARSRGLYGRAMAKRASSCGGRRPFTADDALIWDRRSSFLVFITLREPTGPMVSEAAKAGFLETPFGRFQRMQVVSVATLLDGKLPKLPPQE